MSGRDQLVAQPQSTRAAVNGDTGGRAGVRADNLGEEKQTIAAGQAAGVVLFLQNRSFPLPARARRKRPAGFVCEYATIIETGRAEHGEA
jgi:hypothetical protein